MTEFDFDVLYKRVENKPNADALSRITCFVEINSLLSDGEIINAQNNYDMLNKIKKELKRKKDKNFKKDNCNLCKYNKIFHQLRMIERSHYRNNYVDLDDNQADYLLVFESLKKEFLAYGYDFLMRGHFSLEKTLKRLRKICYWPDMWNDILKNCKKCVNCQEATNKSSKTPLPPI